MDFKIQRRNSLHQEVDGLWDDLEKEEDTFVEHRIKLNECSMLRRVLGADKADVLPKVRMRVRDWVGGLGEGMAVVRCWAGWAAAAGS